MYCKKLVLLKNSSFKFYNERIIHIKKNKEIYYLYRNSSIIFINTTMNKLLLFKKNNFRNSTYFLVTLFFINLSFSHHLHSQNNFEKADSIAFHTEDSFDNPKDLALHLTKSLDSDIDKARVFYMWLAKNVRYDCKKFHNRKKPNLSARTQQEYEEKLEQYYIAQLGKTVKRKKGVCEDYSRLFKALCDEVGLEAEYIVGVSRDHYRPYKKVHNNSHAWNAVKIDGEWHLLDATWGAGYTDSKVKKFTRKVTTGYFLTPPAAFAQNHLPKDEKWQLLEQPISKNNFGKQPVVNYGRDDYKIVTFSPEVFQTKGADSHKEIWFEFENAPKEFSVATKAGKPVPFTKKEEDGKVILIFSSSAKQKIIIYGGKSKRSKMDWIAKYKL